MWRKHEIHLNTYVKETWDTVRYKYEDTHNAFFLKTFANVVVISTNTCIDHHLNDLKMLIKNTQKST